VLQQEICSCGYREREIVLEEGADDGIQACFVPEARQAVLHLIRHIFGGGGLQ
jgi:C4-type Zn-finger protein